MMKQVCQPILFCCLTRLVDLWAVGCIMAQVLLNAKTPFFDGSDQAGLLENIVYVVGSPDTETIQKMSHTRSSVKVSS